MTTRPLDSLTTSAAWPADQFYWAVLEAPACAKPGVLPAGLMPDLAEQIPISIDGLQMVAAPTGDGRIVVCAAAVERLLALEPSILRLTPDAVPQEVHPTFRDVDQLNLLVGPCEPARVRRSRIRRHLAAAAMLMAMSGLLALGLLRREAHARQVSEAARHATAAALEQAGVPGASSAELADMLAHQRRMAGVDLASRRPPDAAAALASLLRSWPVELAARPTSVSIGPEGANLAVVVPADGGDPAAFISALQAPDGWRIDEPRLTAVDKQTRLSITMRPAREGRP